MKIEEYAILHNINLVPVCLRMEKREDGKIVKHFIPTSKFINEYINGETTKTNDWIMNKKIYQDYMEKESIRSQYEKQKEKQEIELLWAMDTSKYYQIDIDDPKYMEEERTKKILEEGIWYKSSTKRLPKVICKPLKKTTKKNIKYEDGLIEMQCGLWSFIKMGEEVYNTEEEIYENERKMEKTFEMFIENYITREMYKKKEMRDEKKEKSQCVFMNNVIDNTDIGNENKIITKERIERLIEEIGEEEADSYNTWNKFRFCLKGYCMDNKCNEWGREMFHRFSKKCEKKYKKDQCDVDWDRDNKGEYYIGYFINLDNTYKSNIFRKEKKKIISVKNDEYVNELLNELVGHLMGYLDEEEEEELLKIRGRKVFLVELIEKTIDKINVKDKKYKTMLKYNIIPLFTYFIFSYKMTKKLLELQWFKIGGSELYGQYVNDKLERLNINTIKHIRYYDDEETNGSFATRWMYDNTIRYYNGYVFNPKTKENINNCFNTFIGFRGEWLEYDGKEEEDEKRILKEYRELKKDTEECKNVEEIVNKYILEKICGGDERFYEYFLNYLAHIIQKPHIKTRVNVILKGIQGTGKGQFFNFFGNGIMGELYYISTASAERILGKFNEHIETKILINWDETSTKSTFENNDDIKKLITDSGMCTEGKGKDLRLTENYINFISTTNEDCPYNVQVNDRRYTGVESFAKRMNDKEARYYSRLFNINNVMLIKRYYKFLMERDIKDIMLDYTRVETNFYKQCKDIGLSPVIRYLGDMVIDMEWFYFHKKEDGDIEITKQELFRRYNTWKDEYSKTTRPISYNTFCRMLNKLESLKEGRKTKQGGFDALTYIFKEENLKQELIKMGLTGI